MRKFEKISFEQFKKDICDDLELYNNYELPVRHSAKSAGYDIRSLNDGIIKPGKSMVFRTGLKVRMNKDDVLYIIGRSSLGYKYDVCLVNSVGVFCTVSNFFCIAFSQLRLYNLYKEKCFNI